MAGNKIKNDIKRVKLIDPNDFIHQYAGDSFSDNNFNMSVPTEDLGIVVELSTYAKSRSILSSQSNGTTTVSNKKINTTFNNNEIINLMTFSSDNNTGDQPNLTTQYTNLSTQLDGIDEALGLTSIDIDFNSSYTPMVNISFVDVRGGALFQQGGSSKYSVFFRLPYPLFQLKIKGFYGKPVVYCLHLTKFNSRFNSQTGNFEITTNFVGYTYALLSDMIIGYLKAAGETKRGKELLALRGIPSINSFLQKISQIDDAIKGQLANTNDDAVTLALYQQAEGLINGLINDVDKYISSLQSTYSMSRNLLVSDLTNKDVIVIDSNNNKDVANELTKSVDDFNKNFSENVANYNKLTNNTELSLIAGLSPVKFETNNAELKQPISNETKTKLQNLYSLYNINDENKINDLVNNVLQPAIKITSNNNVTIIDFTNVYATLRNQSGSLTEQEKNIENALGEQLYKKIKSILQFDPNIRNITNLFTTHIEILLQLILETSSRWKDNSRIIQLSKFKEGTIDVKQKDIDKKDVFPWPEYQQNGIEKYLGGPNVVPNPEQIPEIQLVDELFNGMLVSDKVLKNLDNLVGKGPAAWYAMNPVDSYKYQQTLPYDRLPASSVPKDIATYILMRASGFMGFSNACLSKDELKAFATSEVSAIVSKFSSNPNILNALTENYKTGSDYVDKTNVLYIKPSDLQLPQAYEYIATTETKYDKNNKQIIVKSVLPTDENFFEIYTLNTTSGVKNTEPSVYMLSSLNSQTGMSESFNIQMAADNAYYVDFISKSNYETPSITPAVSYTSNAIKASGLRLDFKTSTTSFTQKIINTFDAGEGSIKDRITTHLGLVGFNAGYGKYGVQDLIQIDYAGMQEELGINNIQPMYSIFYSNANESTPVLTGGRTAKTLFKDEDLFDTNIQHTNNFKILNSGTNLNDTLFKNHTTRGNNLPFFNSKDNLKDVSFPFFGMGIKYNLPDGSGPFETFQNLFGSRLYNVQQNNYSKAYLFLHSFPWMGLIGEREKTTGPFNTRYIINLFQYRTSFIQVPKLFPAFIGAIIWRYEKGGLRNDGTTFKSTLNFDKIGSIGDPIIFSNNNAGVYDSYIYSYNSKLDNHPKSYEYCISKDKSVYQYALRFNDLGQYYNVENIITDLPDAAKQRFVNEFNDFINGNNEFVGSGFMDIINKFELQPITSTNNKDNDWVNAYKGILAKETNSTNNLDNILQYISPNIINGDARTFMFNNYNVLSYFTSLPNNYLIEYKQNGDLDNTLKNLFFDYKYFANFSWRLWNKGENGYRDTVNTQILLDNRDPRVFLPLDSFDEYIGYVIAEIAAAKKADSSQYFNNKNLIDVKFEIYRTLKKIYDKWIANSSLDKPSNVIFQCCTTGGILGNPDRLSSDTAMHNHISEYNVTPNTPDLNLIDSFRFINRAFVDIGDKLPLNPITISKFLIESTDTSFYDFFGRILTDNNLIFVPLPTFIDYSKNEELENVFKPYPYYEFATTTTSGPSFVCMYVGQTSTKLNLGNNCEYPDDGMNLTPTGVGDDMKLDLQDFEMPTAAFLVRYGQQNQNIFKDIVLDQSEFTETAESLKITDAIANSYSQTNQSYVGQNLYNVWSARSYKAEVTMMGNAMIQPMMYFQLDNIPMFRGAYLVTGVKHHIVPNNMSTVFTGVRIRKVATPLIEVATLYSSLLQGYTLPTDGVVKTISQKYTNYVYKYQAILKANLPKDTTIQRKASLQNFDIKQISDNSRIQLKNWGGGTLSENSADGTTLINSYLVKPNLYNFSLLIQVPSQPWSSLFVSYIMTFGDKQFPAGLRHYDYATQALDGNFGYELFPLKCGLKIKAEVGDIMILPRDGGYEASHGNIIWKIQDNKAYLIGGNRGLIPETTELSAVNHSTKDSKNDGTVKSNTIELDNGYITDNTKIGLYLLIMKKTEKEYYKGKPLSTTDGNPAQISNIPRNVTLSNAQIAENQLLVKNLLKQHFLGVQKFSDDKAKIYTAAIMGNIKQESDFNPSVTFKDRNGYESYGLYQMNTAPDDYPNFEKDAGQTVESQINYLYTFPDADGYVAFNDFLKHAAAVPQSQLNAGYIAFIFAQKLERCYNCQDYTKYMAGDEYHQNHRSSSATDFYNRFNTASDPLHW